MHLSMRIALVLGIISILLSNGFLPAIAQDSPQNPPFGYDKGVWVLTNKAPHFDYPDSDAPKRFSVGGNSITVRYDWIAQCSSEGNRPAYYLGTSTWTEPPSVLSPGTKLETIMTVSMEGNPAPCSDGSWGYNGPSEAHVYLYNSVTNTYAHCYMTHADPKPPATSQKAIWDVPWGTIGKTILYSMEFSDGRNSADAYYTYTYQDQKISEQASKPSGQEAPEQYITPFDFGSENHPPTVILSYSPSNPTERDLIEFTAEASDPDGDELIYSWFIDDEEQSDTGSTMSTTLSLGDHTVIVKVSDGKGGTDEDHVHLTVTLSSGISGDVIEAVLLLPITDATVTVEDPDGKVIRRVPVNEEGKYSILLPPGIYRVWASAPGYLPSTGMSGEHVEVEQGILEEDVNFRLVMEPTNGGKPCSTPWTEVFLALNPCNVTLGPTVPAGSYMIWVSPVEGPSGSKPHDWKSYGPYQISARHYYSVVVKGDTGKSRVVVKEDDPETSCYESMLKPGFAYIYFRNDVISYKLHYAMTICSVSGTKLASDDTKRIGG